MLTDDERKTLTEAAELLALDGMLDAAAGAPSLRAAPGLRAALDELETLRKNAEERDCDMHARIRLGYDRAIADAWRGEVAKRDDELERLRAAVRHHADARADLFTAYLRGSPSEVGKALRAFFAATEEP